MHVYVCMCASHVQHTSLASFSLLAYYILIVFFTPLPSHIRLVARLLPVVKYHTFVLPYLSFVPTVQELR